MWLFPDPGAWELYPTFKCGQLPKPLSNIKTNTPTDAAQQRSQGSHSQETQSNQTVVDCVAEAFKEREAQSIWGQETQGYVIICS